MQATLLVTGIAYATTSMLGEYHYARSKHEHEVMSVISEQREAARIFPLNYIFRKESAITLGTLALAQPDPRWGEAALPELLEALKLDPTSADLLAPTITIEIAQDRIADAKRHYAMFKRVAKQSPLIGLVH